MAGKGKGGNSTRVPPPAPPGRVLLSGVHRKVNTFRKKFFVLRAETEHTTARLEYYDSEKKFINGLRPKRSISLKTCFNIENCNHKQKNVIAVYTKTDCFRVMIEPDEEFNLWLKYMQALHNDGPLPGDTSRDSVERDSNPNHFEHVWEVTLLNRGLGSNQLIGHYRLCLSNKHLTLMRCDGTSLSFSLDTIRSCGSLKHYFFLEIGRNSFLGAGELWMNTEDTNIAHNIHATIFHTLSTSKIYKDELGPKGRNRSSSATESSKPNVILKKPHIVCSQCPKNHHGLSAAQGSSQTIHEPTVSPVVTASTSQSQHPIVTGMASIYHHLIHRGTAKAAERRHSVSAGAVPWSGNISHQRTQSLPLAHPAPITDHTITTSHPLRVQTKRSTQSKCVLSRERCDSMPTRARCDSEGNHIMPCGHILTPGQRLQLGSCLRDMSHSPPSGSPQSPPSCSTDSTGSSYSIPDEADGCCTTEMDHNMRYSIPLTPDEAIAEEDCPPDSPCMHDSYVAMGPYSSDDGYQDMSPRGRHSTISPTASMSSVTSGTPSTDIRFHDYPLEKVVSYLSSEDDSNRPLRAYSVGSRTDCALPTHMEVAGESVDNARTRAFSVGSKIKKIPRVLPPHHPHPGVKSSSAPMLTNNTRTYSSHGSIGHMDDLMEMDFSRSSKSSTNSSNHSGYLDMTPGQKTTPSGYVEMKPGVLHLNKTADVSPYVDMRSGASPAKVTTTAVQSPNEYTTFVDLNQYRISSSQEQPRYNDYMDMDPRKNKVHTKNSTSPATSSYPWPGTASNPTGDYMDMNKRSEKNSLYNLMHGSPRQQPEVKQSTPEGYVEMNFGKKQLEKLNNKTSQNDDYTNMTLGSKKKDQKSNKKEKTRSQPITIQTTNSTTVPKNSSSPLSISALLGRKNSSGTPPRMHLPLSNCTTSPFSSLPRQQRSRKNSRRDSKDSSSSSVTTPSSSSTIFPISLNSPSSPSRSDNLPTTATTTLKIPTAILNTVYKSNKPTITNQKNNLDDYTMMDFERNKTGSQKTDTSEYVNYNPTPLKSPLFSKLDYIVTNPGTNKLNNVVPVVATKDNHFVTSSNDSGGATPLITRLVSMNLTNNQPQSNNNCFRPIKDTDGPQSPKLDESDTFEVMERLRKVECTSPAAKISRPSSTTMEDKTRPSSVGAEGATKVSSRPSSTSSELCSSSSTLVDSRPESANSDRIRPGSVSADVLHYASLDLATSANEAQHGDPPTFMYAKIDFLKSEGLKNNSLPNNAKVKH